MGKPSYEMFPEGTMGTRSKTFLTGATGHPAKVKYTE